MQHDQDLDYFRQINKRYQSGDFLVLTFTPKQELFSDAALQTLQSLQNDLSVVEGVENVNSILNVPLLYSPKVSLSGMAKETRTLLSDGVDREQAKQEFWQSPIYRNMLLSPSGQTTALLLNLEVDNRYIELVRQRDSLRLLRDEQGLSDEQAAELALVSLQFRQYQTQTAERSKERVAKVRSIVSQYHDRAEIFIGGVSMITADMINYIQSDLLIFGSAILLFIVAIMALIFRQWRFVLLPLAVCVLSVVMMLGWLSWVDWRLTVISSNFVALLLIMTLAITIHLVVRYREYHAQHPEWSKADLVVATVRAMARPCLYTALTTIVAFVSLVVSDIRPVIDFGWMMTIGLSLSLLLAFLILPAGLMLLPKGESKDKGDGSAAITQRFSQFTERHGNVVLAVAALVAVISAVGISQLKVENRFIDYFHESTEIYQGMSVIDQRLGGTTTLDIVIDRLPPATAKPAEQELASDTNNANSSNDDEFGGDPFAEPANNNGSDEFGGDPFAADEPNGNEFGDEFGDDPFADDPFADPMAEQNADQKDDNSQSTYWFTAAGLSDIEALHDYLNSLSEVGKVQSLATAYKVARDINGSDLNDFELAILRQALPQEINSFLVDPYLSAKHDQVRISMRIIESDPNLQRAKLIEKIREHATTELGFSEEQIHFTGMLVLYNNMLQSLFSSQIVTIGAVFIGILLMFLLLFRSLTIAIIALVPNILAASVVLGGMGLMGIPLDMMTITIAAITVGIGVDHAIHYLHRFKQEFAQNGNYLASMHASHGSIGRAMFYTSVIIIIGFSILALSKFIPSIYFGLLTALAMFAAIMGSLTLLPKLILLTKPLGKESPQ